MIIADAPVLIALAKMRRLDLLRSVHHYVLIGPQVKAETVDDGKVIFAPGVEHIEKALEMVGFRSRDSRRRKGARRTASFPRAVSAQGRPNPLPWPSLANSWKSSMTRQRGQRAARTCFLQIRTRVLNEYGRAPFGDGLSAID